MQLVVFAVVLILPPFLSGDLSSSITEVSDECEFYIREGGDSFCSNHKSEYKTFDLSACTVICENGDQPEFPKGICSGGKLDCTSEKAKQLQDWLLNIWKRSA
uniref:Putative ixodes 10 kDa peptide protein n=1 Tax=Ixodes ricinus TaxID=34613 RepID=A0A0K8RJX6_IXORI